ncbi:hypothetical protein JKP88DRAFT_248950 [Tribonema minus]|uniref:Uncharacterized protein n=1 Tax=Tribonema minus TaxID=303371 RepID=A0A835YME8_9STRA|nr:hypothetical protein JKP88DRAFT_248950 [Tribonema minus]
MAAKDDMKARPEHFDEWSASGSDDDENQHLCAPQGNVVSDSSAADGAATPLLECEESRQQHARTPFIRLAAAYVYTKGLLAHAYLAIMAVSAGLMVGSVVAAYIANGQGTTVVVAAAMSACWYASLGSRAYPAKPVALALLAIFAAASETAMVWLVNARLWCGTPASIGYKFPALIAVFMHAMTCVSPNLGPLHSAWPLRIILDTCIIVHFRLHLQRFPPVPRNFASSKKARQKAHELALLSALAALAAVAAMLAVAAMPSPVPYDRAVRGARMPCTRNQNRSRKSTAC